MMRRFMLIVAALVFASPVMAVVDINAVKVSDGVAITYDNGSDAVRAYALDITVDNGATITGISGFYSGEGAGYGIFPGNFRDIIVPTAPNWAEPNYTPVAPAGDPGAAGALGGSAITIELGSLYDGAPNQPPADGNLCVLTIDAPNGDCNVCISANPERGNVVLEDANEAATNLPKCVKITFAPADCYPSSFGQQYTDWVTLGKPDCWCSPYQCDGDADGTTAGLLKRRVWDNDYDIMAANWGKKITDPTLNPCADFDHKGAGLLKRRVWDPDYDILAANWGKKDTAMPGDCPKVR